MTWTYTTGTAAVAPDIQEPIPPAPVAPGQRAYWLPPPWLTFVAAVIVSSAASIAVLLRGLPQTTPVAVAILAVTALGIIAASVQTALAQQAASRAVLAAQEHQHQERMALLGRGGSG